MSTSKEASLANIGSRLKMSKQLEAVGEFTMRAVAVALHVLEAIGKLVLEAVR